MRLSGVWMFFGVGLVGCSFSAPDVSAPSDARTDAPVDARADGPIDAAFDTDGDGVLDGADNCPAAMNADQLDYDDDGHGDACDGCPHLASTDDPDADHDGVGDACDPRPGAADVRSVWINFAAASSFDGFAQGGKRWLHVNEVASQPDAGPSEGLLVSTIAIPHGLVATRFTVRGTSPVGYAGVCTVAAGAFHCCVLGGSVTNPVVAANTFPPNNPPNTSLYPGGFTIGTTVSVTQVRDTTSNQCTVEGLATAATAMSAGGASTGAVELYTSGVAADFDYLFIVETGS